MLRHVKALGPLIAVVLILWALAGEDQVVAVGIGAGLKVPPCHELGTPLLRRLLRRPEVAGGISSYPPARILLPLR